MRAGCDVVEDELIGALIAIPRGELEDVTHHAMVSELHALDDHAVAYIQTGDYSPGKNL